MVDLPLPGRPDDAQRLARPDLEADVVQHRLALVIGEVDMLERSTPSVGASGRAPGLSAMSGSISRISNRRAPQVVARAADMTIMITCRTGPCRMVR